MKMIKILIISFCIIMILSINVAAVSELFNTAESWETTGKSHVNGTLSSERLKKGTKKLYNILLAAGTAVAIIVGGILGVRYMTAGIDKKVEVKESLFPYIISCIVVFGSLGIWKLVVTIMGQV